MCSTTLASGLFENGPLDVDLKNCSQTKILLPDALSHVSVQNVAFKMSNAKIHTRTHIAHTLNVLLCVCIYSLSAIPYEHVSQLNQLK